MTSISIIIPYYFKYDLFKLTLELNYPYFSIEGREVILMLDNDNEEKEILELVKKYNKIRWKILINRKKHEWRNPSIVLNTAILQAKPGLIFVISPESLMKHDVISQLTEVAIKYNDFACGFVNFCNLKDNNIWEEGEGWHPYGSIAFHSSAAYLVGAYDVRFELYGAEDDSLRGKFKKYLNCRGYYLPSAKIYHLERGVRPKKETSQKNLNLLQNITYSKEIVIDENFELIYDTTI